MRGILSIVLSLLLCITATAAPTHNELISFAKSMKPGQIVIVKLLNKEKVKGTLASATDSAVEIVTFKDKQEARRTIPYDQMKSIDKPSPTWAWVTLGVVAGVVVLLIVGIAAASSS